MDAETRELAQQVQILRSRTFYLDALVFSFGIFIE
jgi:hypothetical protein